MSSKLQFLSAIHNGDYNIVEECLKKGYDCNVTFTARVSNESILHAAVRNNYVSIVELLLRYRAEVDIRDKFGQTPLHYAVEYNLSIMVTILVAYNANINAISTPQTKSPTPLLIAIEKQYYSMIKQLLDTGADINLSNSEGDTPLHLAVTIGRIEIIELLMKYPVQYTAFNHLGETVLHTAVKCGHLSVVKLLCPYVLVDSMTFKDFTPLHYAIQKNHYDIVAYLLTQKPLSSYNCSPKVSDQPPHFIDVFVSDLI